MPRVDGELRLLSTRPLADSGTSFRDLLNGRSVVQTGFSARMSGSGRQQDHL
jgi:hypothetical protein